MVRLDLSCTLTGIRDPEHQACSLLIGYVLGEGLSSGLGPHPGPAKCKVKSRANLECAWSHAGDCSLKRYAQTGNCALVPKGSYEMVPDVRCRFWQGG